MISRSLLFAPGNSARKIERSLASPAGTVLLDLEDSVLPDAKLDARHLVQQALASRGARRAGVRINAQDSEWYRADLIAVVPTAPDYIMLPKCRGVDDLRRLDHELCLLEELHGLSSGRIGVLPLVTEDAGSLCAMDYRSAPRRTAALCVAAEDLASDLGISPRMEDGAFAPPIGQARIAVKIAAAAAGLAAIDTPFPNPREQDQLDRECTEALGMGFEGKLCIHPDQIDIVERIFTPSPERVRWANDVIAALSDGARGAALVDGKMVDIAHLRLAHRLCARAA